jgi:hypothetical protein
MGYWGNGPYDNDTAQDVLDRLRARLGVSLDDDSGFSAEPIVAAIRLSGLAALREIQADEIVTHFLCSPDSLRALAALLVEAGCLDGVDTKSVMQTEESRYYSDAIAELALTLAAAGCLEPGTARAVLKNLAGPPDLGKLQ